MLTQECAKVRSINFKEYLMLESKTRALGITSVVKLASTGLGGCVRSQSGLGLDVTQLIL